MNVTRALKWSFLSEIASKAIVPISFVILARLLTPEDYGVVTAAAMVIAFTQIFWEAGMAKALIQRQTLVDEAANITFWTNISLGILISALIIGNSEFISQNFFQDLRVSTVLRVMTLQVIFGALASVQTALFQKEFEFKKLFWVRLGTVSFPSLASIPLAATGYGYWSLVIGTIAGQLVQAVMLWRMSSWRPKFSFSLEVAKPLAAFGAWVAFSGLLTWFYAWADTLIVGNFLGIKELGIYRVGNQFSALIFTLIMGPVMPVLYSYLSKTSVDKDRLRKNAVRLINLLTIFCVPLAIIVFQYSSFIAQFLFGDSWDGVSLVIGVLALMHGFSWVVGMNGEIYRAMGKPSIETIVTGSTLFVYLIVYIISIKVGFEFFVWTRLALALGALILHLFIMRWVLRVAIAPVLRKIVNFSILTFAITGGIKSLSVGSISMSSTQSFLGMTGSLILVGSLIIWFERNGAVKDLTSILESR